MSSLIIFAPMWGWIFQGWKGSGGKAHWLIAGGVATLVCSTVVIGAGAAMVGGRSFHGILNVLSGGH